MKQYPQYESGRMQSAKRREVCAMGLMITADRQIITLNSDVLSSRGTSHLRRNLVGRITNVLLDSELYSQFFFIVMVLRCDKKRSVDSFRLYTGSVCYIRWLELGNQLPAIKQSILVHWPLTSLFLRGLIILYW